MRLKHVARLIAGGTPTVDAPSIWSDERGLPWVTISDMTREAVVTTTERTVTEVGIKSKKLPVGRPGTILFAMYASVGGTAVLGTTASWNQAILGIQTLPGRADSRFVGYWLGHLRPELTRLFRSNTQDNLNAEQAANLPFPNIEIEAQRKAADFLDAETARIDALIEKKRRMIGLLAERLRAATIEQIFSGEVKSRWGKLARLVDLLPGYAFPSEAFLTEPQGGVRLLRGINVAPSGLRWDETVYLADTDAPAYARFALRAGDLVIGMDRPLIGSGMRVSVVAHNDLPSLLVQRVARLRAKPDADRHYVRFALQSEAFVAHFSPIVTGVSVPHISPEQILSFRLPIPVLEVQQEVGRRLRELEAESAEISKRLERQIGLLLEHRQALITAAVTGEIDLVEAA